MVEFDLILEQNGSLSNRQCIQILLLLIPCTFMASQMGAMVYLGADVEKQCVLPIQEKIVQECNISWGEEQRQNAIPWDNETQRASTCKRYDFSEAIPNCALWQNVNQTNSSTEIIQNATRVTTVECEVWVYENTSLFQSTVVKEFNLVCSNKYKRHLAQSIYMLGVTVGCVVWGHISDRFGRKFAAEAASIIGTLFALAAVFSNSYLLFVVLRTLSGGCLFTVYTTAFVLITEIVAPKYRVKMAQVVQAFFALGFCLLALYGYLIRKWRMLQLVLSVPITGLIVYHWIILESPRWLISNKRYSEALKIVKVLLRKNTEIEDIEEIKALKEAAAGDDMNREEKNGVDTTHQNNHSHGPIELVRTPNIRSKSLKLFYCWFVCSCLYYGLTLNAADIGGDPFINLFISGVVEVPAVFMIIPSLEKCGRRPTLILTLLLAGCACVTMLFVPKELLWLNITLSMLGKFMIAAGFATVYIYAAELYPTPIRNVGMGVCSSMARVGGIISPLIAMLGDLAKPLPYVVFGVMSIIGGLIALFLPEVLGIRLPETMEEGEHFGMDQPGPMDFLFKNRCCVMKTNSGSEATKGDYTVVSSNGNHTDESRV